jgi:hypothetical protein
MLIQSTSTQMLSHTSLTTVGWPSALVQYSQQYTANLEDVIHVILSQIVLVVGNIQVSSSRPDVWELKHVKDVEGFAAKLIQCIDDHLHLLPVSE